MADNKRRSIDLLPVINQTETLTKFFAATLDHLLQPESVEFLTGYIGSKPSYYDASRDYYVSEPTKDRISYQLPISAISKDVNSGRTNNVMFYDDIVNLLGFHGANTANHSRLFDQEYYSWAPPIDIDKLVNYTRYLWLPDGPSTITLLNPTDAANDFIGKTSYTYVGSYSIDGTGTVTVGSLAFTNGMAIILSDDYTSAYTGSKWIVDGVGTEIGLVQDPLLANPPWNTYGWDVSSWDGDESAYQKQYVTIGRHSADRNQWSTGNRWFHESVVALSQTPPTDASNQRALRPIIEFDKNMLLWNHGWYGRPSVDLVIYGIQDVMGAIVGQSSFVYDGITLSDGMRLLVTSDNTNTDVNNRIYTVGDISSKGIIKLTLAIDGQSADGSAAVGDRLLVRFGSYEGKNLWYSTNNTWVSTGQQYSRSSPPLFQLFDVNGTSLSDPSVYTCLLYTSDAADE